MSVARGGSLALAAAIGLTACSLLVDAGDLTSDAVTGSDASTADGPDNEPVVEDPGCPLPAAPPERSQLYISPTGADTNSGTRAEPLRTFASALSRLRPGDALVLLDGVYTTASSGALRVDCGSATNGTPVDPIVVRADHQRAAWVQSDGSRPAVEVGNCSYWTFDGLRATSADFATTVAGAYDIVAITYSKSIRLTRSLLARTNRCIKSSGSQTTNGVFVYTSTGVLIEDNEVYDYHAPGIITYSGGTTLRGNYTNPRNYALAAPPACPVATYTMGQYNITEGAVIENAVSEGNGTGIGVGENTLVVGSVALNNDYGIVGQPSWIALAKGAVVRDTVVVNNNRGLRSEAWVFSLENVTIAGNTLSGITLANNGGTGKPPRNFYLSKSLLFQNGALDFQTVDDWYFDYVNSFGNVPKDFPIVEPIDDTVGNVRESMSVDPGMGIGSGQCVVYPPPSSPMRDAAKGASIGANLVIRYRDGQPTCERFWNRTTGRIRCGATVAGVNDDPNGDTVQTRACINVHRRLNFREGGCPIP